MKKQVPGYIIFAVIALATVVLIFTGNDYSSKSGSSSPAPSATPQFPSEVQTEPDEQPGSTGRFFSNLPTDRQQIVVVRENQDQGQIIGGIVPNPYTEIDMVVVYVKSDEWWIQPDSENYFTGIDEEGYFELISNAGNEVVIYVVSTTDIDFPLIISRDDQLPEPDGIFIMNKFRQKLQDMVQ